VARRIDTVRFATKRGEIAMPWESRTALLERIESVPSGEALGRKFRRSETSALVDLTDTEDSLFVLEVVKLWTNDEPNGASGLPEGIWSLRNAIV
jgi:hypothetical protein